MRRTAGWRGYLVSLLGVVLMTLVLTALESHRHIANDSMLFLLVVMGVAVRYGSGPAVWASLLSFYAFDWFFVEPRLRLTVSDPAEWVALLLFLCTAITIGQMTALLRSRAEEAGQREVEAAALAEASWSVASQLDVEHALGVVIERAMQVTGARDAAVLTDDGEGRQVLARAGEPIDVLGEPDLLVVPLGAEERLGYLALRLPPGRQVSVAERRAANSLALHAGVVIERERLMHIEAQTQALHEADRLKTALLSMISHDFRSPLAAIKASAGSLLAPGEPVDADTHRELLSGIISAVDRLNRMVENVLALSRLEAGAWRPMVEPTPVEEVVASALEALDAEANARIEVNMEAGLGEVEVDPVQMAQVLYNLVENALKYSPPRSPVELRAWRGYGRLVLEVADRGPGLPPHSEEFLFQPFWRGPGQGESARAGVGLGLALCRGLVEAHGGVITARRRQGGGAVFRVELPKEMGA